MSKSIPTLQSLDANLPPDLKLVPHVSPSTGFTFPKLFSFPPFFTKQPNEKTWAHQSAQWTSLILGWCRATKVYSFAVTEETTTSSELFHNRTINRRLLLPTLRLVLDGMVAAGLAEYDPPSSSARGAKSSPTNVWIYWRRPEEWAALIYAYIESTGQASTIMTFYELVEAGDLVEQQEFYRLPEPLLRKALDVLVKQGKAQVFKGVLGEEGDGVKFA